MSDYVERIARKNRAGSAGGSSNIPAEKTELAEVEKEKLTSGLGAGGAKSTQAKTAPVKQNSGESLQDYSKRLREQRSAESTAGDQADALEKKRKKD